MSNFRIIDPILTSHAKGYTQAEFIARALFPTVMVDRNGGQVLRYGREDFMITDDTRRPGDNTRRVKVGQYTGEKFTLSHHSLEGEVPSEYIVDAQEPGVNLQRNAVNSVMQKIELNRENEAAEMAMDVANYPVGNTVALAGTDQWTDPASLPFRDIEDAKEVIRGQTGRYPNVMVMGATVRKAARDHPKLRENYRYTSSSSITNEMIRNYFDIDRMEIGAGIYWDAAAARMQDLWGKSVILAYVSEEMAGNSIENARPSYGYTYTLRSHPIAEIGYYERNPKTWYYPVTYDRVPVISCPEAAVLISNVVP